MAQVAVVVRTKDRPALLARALRSIAGQRHDDWEVVVVNDGGDPERLGRVIAGAGERVRSRTRVVDHEHSLGRWRSANAGVAASSAEYLVLHDDDDSWDPGFLDAAAAHLEAHPLAPGVVSRIEIVWEEERDGDYVELGREPFQAQLTAPLLGDALLFNRFVPIAFLYRRAVHDELGLYDEALPVVGDWEFALRVLSRWPLAYLPGPPLARWHQRRAAAGAEGNSVIADGDAHARTDALVRDAALREYVAEHGLGLPLYLTAFIDRRLVEVEASLREEIRSGEAVVGAARRAWRRAFGPPRRARRR